MAERGECAYKRAHVAEEFHCPPCDEEKPTRQVREYYVGAARQKLGPHMLLCRAHAAWWNEAHPAFMAAQATAR
jgi:hypothetical protein